jgi:hypothetical protein
LGTFLRQSRLALTVCLVYVWLVSTGEHVLTTNRAHEVDRADRRDLSVFRIGWDFIERCLGLNDPISIAYVPSFGKVSAFDFSCPVTQDVLALRVAKAG